MGGRGASYPSIAQLSHAVQTALGELALSRRGVDRPSLYVRAPHPWTDKLGGLLLSHFGTVLDEEIYTSQLSAHLGFSHRLPLRHLPDHIHITHPWMNELGLKILARPNSHLIGYPLAFEAAWCGNWPHIIDRIDRLAVTRADLKVLCVSGDPHRDMGTMTLSQALAYRLSAGTPKGQMALLAFWQGCESQSGEEGFSVFSYQTGERDLIAL
ncbi:hypothetical protein [Woodsholea maritima]|uniref:hypothetical protein n=1 Tax=Woodsholea maritima TaxID=240237 RepID=UPI00036A4706|nr:hypothetical protein [Woodsholea maritima]